MQKTVGLILLCALAATVAVVWRWSQGDAVAAPVVELTSDRTPPALPPPAEAPTARVTAPTLDDLTEGLVEPAPPAQTARLHGRVTDADHRPVAGARVALHVRGIALAATTTDTDGGYRLAEVPAYGLFELWIQPNRGWLPEKRDLGMEGPGDRGLDLELTRTATVQCAVRDAETQAPVPGAELRLDELPGRFARCGVDGHVELQLPLGMPRLLLVTAPGYAPIRHGLKLADEDRDRSLELRLARGARVRGRVVDLAGTPVLGAQLDLWRVSLPRARRADRERAARGTLPRLAPGSTLIGEGLTPSTVSAADGGFEFTGIAGVDGVFHGLVRATCDGFCDTASEPIDLDSPAREASVTLTLPRGGLVVGRLSHRGQPCIGTVWGRVEQDGDHDDRRETDAEGRFRLGPFRAGVVELTAVAGLRGAQLETSVPVTVTVREGSPSQIDLELQPEPPPEQRRLAGSVRDAEGRPLSGVTVRCTREDRPGVTDELSATTSDNGHWQLQVAGTASYTVAVLDRGSARRYEHVRPPRQDLDFAVRRDGRLRLDVLCADGGHPSGLVVFVRLSGSDTWWQYEKDVEGRGSSTVLEPDDLLALPVGPLDLRIDALGYAATELHGVPVAVEPSAVRVVITPGHTVTLLLTGDAEAQEAREIYLVPAELTRVPERTTLVPLGADWFPSADPDQGLGPIRRLRFQDGTLRATCVAPGRYRVVSADGDLAFEPELLEAGDADRALRMRVTLRR